MRGGGQGWGEEDQGAHLDDGSLTCINQVLPGEGGGAAAVLPAFTSVASSQAERHTHTHTPSGCDLVCLPKLPQPAFHILKHVRVMPY